MTARLQSLGFDVTDVGVGATSYRADLPFVPIDLHKTNFSSPLGECIRPLVALIEVIERVKSLLGFLSNIGRLLKLDGITMVTARNVDNAPVKMKFILTG